MSSTTAASTALTAKPAQRVPLGGVLTPRMERMIRTFSVGSAIIIAVSAMVLSYSGLLDLAIDAEISPELALLVPVMVDGLQFVGSLGVVYSTLSGLRSWYPWVLMLMGVSVSAWGNWQAAPDDLTAKLLHASAPIILALVLEELLRVMRHKVQAHNRAYEAAQEAAQEALGSMASENETAPSPVPPLDTGAVLPPPAVANQTLVAPVAPQGTTTDQVGLVAVAEPSRFSTSAVEGPEVLDVTPVSEEPPAPAVETGSTWDPRELPTPLSTLRSNTTPAVAEAAPQTPGSGAPTNDTATGETKNDTTSPTNTGDGDEDDDALPPYPEGVTFKEQVKAILSADPEIKPAHIARKMKKDGSYTRKIVREARAELDAESVEPPVEPPVQSVVESVVESVESPDAFAAIVPTSPVMPGASDVRTGVNDDDENADPFAAAVYVAR